jgi:chemotaxis protein histidine kinase CheA
MRRSARKPRRGPARHVGWLRPQCADGDIETVHAVFRAVHSIKGGAGAFGLDDLVTFAHLFETVLDEMRGGKMDGRRGCHARPAARG